MLVYRKVTSQHFSRLPRQYAGTHLYSWMERGIVKVECFSQEHSRATVETRPFS